MHSEARTSEHQDAHALLLSFAHPKKKQQQKKNTSQPPHVLRLSGSFLGRVCVSRSIRRHLSATLAFSPRAEHLIRGPNLLRVVHPTPARTDGAHEKQGPAALVLPPRTHISGAKTATTQRRQSVSSRIPKIDHPGLPACLPDWRQRNAAYPGCRLSGRGDRVGPRLTAPPSALPSLGGAYRRPLPRLLPLRRRRRACTSHRTRLGRGHGEGRLSAGPKFMTLSLPGGTT